MLSWNLLLLRNYVLLSNLSLRVVLRVLLESLQVHVRLIAVVYLVYFLRVVYDLKRFIRGLVVGKLIL